MVQRTHRIMAHREQTVETVCRVAYTMRLQVSSVRAEQRRTVVRGPTMSSQIHTTACSSEPFREGSVRISAGRCGGDGTGEGDSPAPVVGVFVLLDPPNGERII